MSRLLTIVFTAFAGLTAFTGCATAPKTASDQRSLEQRAQATLTEMTGRDPSLHDVLAQANAYAVFPEIGKGGMIVGGAFGRGILYENGVASGYVSLQQASIGAQLGGQTFAELLVLRDPGEVHRLKSGQYQLGADMSAVVLHAGAATSASFNQNASVFVLTRGGLMVDVSVAGQKINYQPLSA